VAGYSCQEAKNAGFDLSNIHAAGFSFDEASKAEWTETYYITDNNNQRVRRHRQVRFTYDQMLPVYNVSILDLRSAGHNKAGEFAKVRCATAKAMKDAGFTAEELRVVTSDGRYRSEAGGFFALFFTFAWSSPSMRDAGYSAAWICTHASSKDANHVTRDGQQLCCFCAQRAVKR